MPFGYNGKILHVDLTTSDLSVETPPEIFYRRYFGGRGFIAYYLLKEMKGGEDPLGLENVLVFASSVLGGAPAHGVCRFSVGAKSPLTRTCAEAEVSGYWGAELRKAGYDGIIIKGISEKPVYLWIHNETIELRDAKVIWGSKVKQSLSWLQKDVGEVKCRAAIKGKTRHHTFPTGVILRPTRF